MRLRTSEGAAHLKQQFAADNRAKKCHSKKAQASMDLAVITE